MNYIIFLTAISRDLALTAELNLNPSLARCSTKIMLIGRISCISRNWFCWKTKTVRENRIHSLLISVSQLDASDFNVFIKLEILLRLEKERIRWEFEGDLFMTSDHKVNY